MYQHTTMILPTTMGTFHDLNCFGHMIYMTQTGGARGRLGLKGWCWLCVRDELETGTDWYIDPKFFWP